MKEPLTEIVYLDETSFNLWQSPKRCWLSAGTCLTLPNNRGPSMTLIGAISERRGLIYHSIIIGSNNAQVFASFIKNLKDRSLASTVVYMDNYSVHKAKHVIEHFGRGFEQRFLPPYSCAMNPIERLWRLIKHHWTKGMHSFTEDTKEQ